MTRTFIAVLFPEAVRAALQRELARLARVAPSVRWVNPEGPHLTLAFLGTLDDAALQQATEATEVAASSARPFTLRLEGLGTFGSPGSPRVVWAGVAGEIAALHTLQVALADALEERGFPREARPYSPHLTLARIKAPLPATERERLTEALAQPRLDRVSWRVEDVAVMKSELRRAGARYTPLRTVALGHGRAQGQDRSR